MPDPYFDEKRDARDAAFERAVGCVTILVGLSGIALIIVVFIVLVRLAIKI